MKKDKTPKKKYKVGILNGAYVIIVSYIEDGVEVTRVLNEQELEFIVTELNQKSI